MKIVFFGTSQFAVPSLQALKESRHKIEAVFTQPDRKGGRNLQTIESPVKKWAKKQDVDLYQPEKISDEKDTLKEKKADVFVVVGYGNILPEDIINLPKYYSVNVHPSLLPEYRGAAPVNWAIINADNKTGVTVYKLSQEIDGGDILLKKKVKIERSDTNITLNEKLAKEGADLLLEALEKIEKGEIQPVPQEESLVTYAPKLKKEDGLIDWQKPAEDIHNLIKGTKKWPSAFTYFNGKLLKIYEAEVIKGKELKEKAKAGEIVKVKKGSGIIVKTKKDYLNILKLQLEGKKKMPSSQFILGYKIKEGNLLGD
jgi:methionyl-tRNA formyltransferase